MHVAMVGLRAPWGTEGGVETAVGELAPRLVARGCRVTVHCRRRYNALGEGLHKGVELVDTGTIYRRGVEAFVHTALATPKALGADLVHFHAMGPALMSWLPRVTGRGTVVTIHGLDHQRAKWGPVARGVLSAGAWSAAHAPHARIVVGSHLGEWFGEHYGVPSTVIPNGVAPIPPQPLAASGVEGLEPRGFLLFVGRLVPEKGLDQLLAAYARSGCALPLVIAGGDRQSEAYASALRAGAPPGVRFVGSRRGVERDALLSHARALVLPSLLEGFPLAPLEAMEAGLPVVLSDIPPHQEVLGAEVDRAGWLVPQGGWEAALARLQVLSAETQASMGSLGRARVRAQFSWDAAADATLAVYRQVLARKP